MLRFLREKGNSWILKGLLAFVALTFVSWGGYSATQGPSVPGGKVAAWVDEVPISAFEFERRYYRQTEAMRRQLGAAYNDELAQQLGLRQRVLAGLVFEVLQLREAERLGIRATDKEVALRIQELPSFRRFGRFDPALYRQLLDANRLTPRQFEEQQRRLLILERLRRYVGMGATVSEQEVRDAYRWENERARLEVVRLRPALFEKDVPALEADLRAYYEKNKESYRTGPQRKAAWWYLPYEAVKPLVKVGEKELRARYAETRSRYLLRDKMSVSQILLKLAPGAPRPEAEKARALLAGLRARALRGEDFAALARKYSQGPAASQGGDLGTFGPGEMLADIEKVAKRLKKGEVSQPVRTSFGYHLIWMRDRQRKRQQTFEEARAKVLDEVRGRKARARAARELRRARYAIEDKKPVPEIPGLRRGETGFFEKDRPPAAHPAGALLAEVVFKLKKKGDISSEQEGTGGALFARLEGVKAPAVPPFEQVAQKVRRDYLREKGAEAALRKAEGWLRELRGGGRTLAGLARELGVRVETPPGFTRSKPPAALGGDREIVRKAFALRKGGYDRVKAGIDVLLLHAVASPSADMAGFAKGKEALKKRLLAQKRGLLFSRYIEELRQASKVRLDRSFTL